MLFVAAACSGGEAEAPGASVPTATVAPASTGSDRPATRDLVDLARRYTGATSLQRTVDLPEPSLGDVVEFDVLMISPDHDAEPETRRVKAELVAVSRHAYFFFEQTYELDSEDLDAAVAAFEDRIWPGVTGVFGPPPSPGVDGDDRIVLLHADLGAAIGGYVSDLDTYPKAIVPLSNQRETVYLNVEAILPGTPSYVAVLAHELQHLSHLALDADEAAWVNEGLSEFASALVTGSAGSFGAFLDRPDTQLNAWDEIGGTARHYQASDLFFQYLIEQTNGDIAVLAARPENSVDGVAAFLVETGSERSFAEFVADWAVANYVDAPDGPYGYGEIDVNPPLGLEAKESESRQVSQFAADYLLVDADHFGSGTVFEFQGAESVPRLAAQAGADGTFWWSGRGDNIDATLTREIDLTRVTSATLTFRTWYDIERWYDYAYVSVSQDGGATWQALDGRRTTTDDPVGVAYGPGYSGTSDGWVDERIDLTGFAGSVIQLRFEYITDTAQQRPGFAIDDIAVPEIGFFDDGQSDVGGWRREGFRLLSEPLDQTFELRLITMTSPPAVQSIAVAGGNRAAVSLPGLGVDYERAIVVVVATTDGTTELASYQYDVTRSADSG